MRKTMQGLMRMPAIRRRDVVEAFMTVRAMVGWLLNGAVPRIAATSSSGVATPRTMEDGL